MSSRCPCGYTGCTHEIVYCSRCRSGYEIGTRHFWGYRRVCPSCYDDYLCRRNWHDLEDASFDTETFIKTLQLLETDIDTLGIRIQSLRDYLNEADSKG